ncbi:MAG: beta-N-acetylglucosaminidase domain-containing protein [Rikenellaceae bacterium]
MRKTFTLLLSLFLLIACGTTAQSERARLNPQPHSVEYTSENLIDITRGFTLTPNSSSLHGSLDFANKGEGALPITVSFGEQVAAQNGVKADDGAYMLRTSKDGVEIVGYNERGAYYAAQTLKQLCQNNQMPEVKILDYSDMPYRGVVEGFYGTPWSHEVRTSLIDYYGEYKMNSYLYGPKDDQYHSSPYWREPYPTEEAQKIKELVEASNKNYVDFIWAIHPGLDIQWTESDYQKLLAKFNSMYDLGVRSFALFFDDISGIGTRATKQAELLNRLQSEFVEVKGDVKPLIMCPTDYCGLWADGSETGYLSILGDTLHPSIHIMWTGDAVCCDITDSSLAWVNRLINRPTFIWWNYPVTDYVKHIVLQGPVYGNSQKATRETMAGFVSNPMEHGEASKIALYGVADYTWNIAGYNAMENWEGAIKALMPDAADAYRTFAIHSTDTETGYRRDESWETTTFKYNDYTEEEYKALYAEFQRVKAAAKTIFEKGGNELLIGELRPWLVEFEKLGERGVTALELIKKLEAKDNAAFWDMYRNSTMSGEEFDSYKAHRSGTTKLMPFVNTTRGDLALAFYSSLSGKPAYETVPVGSFLNIDSREISGLMLDGKSDTHYSSAEAQKSGNWVGVDLGTAKKVNHIYIEQGRNNVDDVDYFDAARLEGSLDGTSWVALCDDFGAGNYVIDYRVSEDEAQEFRYIRLLRLDESKRTNWMSVRRFEVNPTLSEPRFFTNVAQLATRTLGGSDSQIVLDKVLEVVKVQPEGYFAVELPVVTTLGAIQANVSGGDMAMEYSLDGAEWKALGQKGGVAARFVRAVNKSDKELNVKIDGVSIALLSSGGSELNLLMDANINTAYLNKGATTLVVPEGSSKVVVLTSGEECKVVQRDATGAELSASTLSASLSEIALVSGTTRLEIVGSVGVYEVIFRSPLK